MPRGSYRHMLLLFAKKRLQSGTEAQKDYLIEIFQIGQIEDAMDAEIRTLANRQSYPWTLESGKPACYEADLVKWKKLRRKIWDRVPDYVKKNARGNYERPDWAS